MNEVSGLGSHQGLWGISVEELKSLEGKVLNCDRVTTNMADEIRRIGLNFEDAEKRVHGVEAMAEGHKASISQFIRQVHNLEHPAALSISTGEVAEAKVRATEVRRIAVNLKTQVHKRLRSGAKCTIERLCLSQSWPRLRPWSYR